MPKRSISQVTYRLDAASEVKTLAITNTLTYRLYAVPDFKTQL